MKRIVFLVSGGGGTLRFVHQYLQNAKIIDWEIATVIADRKCEALNFAKEKNIPNQLINYSISNKSELQNCLEKMDADFIITTIHQLIDTDTVKKYEGKLINLHYSLLPDFKGFNDVHTLRHILSAGKKTSGTTVHFVNEKLDEGEIISQNYFELNIEKEFDSLMNLVFRAGCLNLLNTLFYLNEKNTISKKNEIQLLNENIKFDKQFLLNENLLNKDFWKQI